MLLGRLEYADPMLFAVMNLLIVGGMFAAMLALQEVGRRQGERDRRRLSLVDRIEPGPAAGAVYGLLGLYLAFTFSGAGARYEVRRHLVVEEANAIGTAWLRIDLLPPSTQPPLRNLFQTYVDSRIESYQKSPRAPVARSTAAALQREIWSTAVNAAKSSGEVPALTVLLPAVNEMIDIATTREEARRLHPPIAVFVMLAFLALIGSLVAGYTVAGAPPLRLPAICFAGVMALAIFVIIDYELPRFGVLRIDVADSVLMDVRRSMN